MSASLELLEVSKRRGEGRRAVTALEGVTLSLGAGELALLEGPSGSGKTTLLAVAAGLLTPDSGRVVLGGLRLEEAGPRARASWRARHVGFVFQRPSLLEELTVRENVLLTASLAGLTRPDASRETASVLAALGLTPLLDRRPRELSGGEEQRVAVARALVHRPEVVLADEPTASLDGEAGRAVAEGLLELARSRRAAVLLATHDARLVPYASRRFRIADGRLSPLESIP